MPVPPFTESFLHAPRAHEVMGRRLRPFCCWHELMLRTIESPLVVPGKNLDWLDLETAALICQTRFQEQLPAPPRWWQRIGFFLRLRGRSIAGEVAKFHAYIGDFFDPPRFWFWDEEGGKVPTKGQMPELLNTVSCAMLLTGLPPHSVWEMPKGEAYWYAAAWQRHHGQDLDFWTERDYEAEKRLRSRPPAADPPPEQRTEPVADFEI